MKIKQIFLTGAAVRKSDAFGAFLISELPNSGSQYSDIFSHNTWNIEVYPTILASVLTVVSQASYAEVDACSSLEH